LKPWSHARSSAHKFGGSPEDYIEIHNFFDSTKSVVADMRHRAILHNAFGIFLAESTFGTMVKVKGKGWQKMPWIKNSKGEVVQVRDIGEQHVIEDLGRIPGLEECMKNLPMEAWFGGPIRKKKLIRLEDLSDLIPGLKDAKVELGIED